MDMCFAKFAGTVAVWSGAAACSFFSPGHGLASIVGGVIATFVVWCHDRKIS